MSYDISLENAGPVPRHYEGGHYNTSGAHEAQLNVTYNYAKHFDFRALDKQLAQNVTMLLQDAVIKLGTEQDSDYWAPTPGNTGYACLILLMWARLFPNATFVVD